MFSAWVLWAAAGLILPLLLGRTLLVRPLGLLLLLINSWALLLLRGEWLLPGPLLLLLEALLLL